MCVFCVFVSFVFDLFISLYSQNKKKKTYEKFYPLRFWAYSVISSPFALWLCNLCNKTMKHPKKQNQTHTLKHEHDCVYETLSRSRSLYPDHHHDVNCKTILRFPSENLTSRAFQSNMDEILLHIQETEARVHNAPVQSDEPQLYATRGAWRREVDTLLVPTAGVGVWEAFLLRSDIQGETRHCLHISGA